MWTAKQKIPNIHHAKMHNLKPAHQIFYLQTHLGDSKKLGGKFRREYTVE